MPVRHRPAVRMPLATSSVNSVAIVFSRAYEPGNEPEVLADIHHLEAGLPMTFHGWYEIKQFLEHSSGISMDALHILVGFLIFLLAAQLLRRSVASPLPWLTLLMLELANEAYDLHVEIWPNLANQLGEGTKDIILTMALPTLVMLLARRRPALLGRGADR